MIARNDLLGPDSPKGLEVFQLTGEDVPSCHLYMEAQVFAPDSKRFVLHRSATAHGGDPADPEHRYLLCDLEDGGALSPLADELGVRAPSVSPDGEWMYYFLDETRQKAGRFTLKRVRLDGTGRETLHVLDGPIPGEGLRFSRPYPLSTISSDGKRLAISGLLGDGDVSPPVFGLLVYDLAAPEPKLILRGPTWCNVHPQYSRSQAPDASHDLLVQENHGCEVSPDGKLVRLTGGAGADIHVIRDDGEDFRNMPWGRVEGERCQGHQCWRGRSETGITSTSGPEARLIEGRAAPHTGHVGADSPGGWRNDLTRDFPAPSFHHFATDLRGERLITDCGPFDQGGRIFLMDLPEREGDPATRFTCLLNARCSCVKESHIHPFLSPDGNTGFFNSDESGVLQAYMIRGLDAVGE